MKKLINGNIELNKNDIRVLKEEDHIEVHLKNKEKAIHEMNGKQWGHYNEDGDAYFGDHNNVIGYMNLYTQLKSNGVKLQ